MADDIDHITAATILVTHLRDIDESTGSHEDGEISTDDAQFALRVYKEELERRVASLRDQRTQYCRDTFNSY